MKPRFFKSSAELRKWLEKNHDKAEELWVGLHKSHSREPSMTQKEAVDQALCFGWSFGIIKGIDAFTYMIRFLPRKPKGAWSATSIKRAKELKKLGLMHEAGWKLLLGRDREKSEEAPPEFTPQQLRRFKANKKAWEFFSEQTPSYRKYMILWVTKAKKPETQAKRLQMLIDDSARGSKLSRIVKANEKIKNRHKPGETPIEEARNIGPVSGAELRSVGIETVEQLQALGWEKSFYRLCEMYPNRLNFNMLTALIGAVECQDWRAIDPEIKAEAKAILREMKERY